MEEVCKVIEHHFASIMVQHAAQKKSVEKLAKQHPTVCLAWNIGLGWTNCIVVHCQCIANNWLSGPGRLNFPRSPLVLVASRAGQDLTSVVKPLAQGPCHLRVSFLATCDLFIETCGASSSREALSSSVRQIHQICYSWRALRTG